MSSISASIRKWLDRVSNPKQSYAFVNDRKLDISTPQCSTTTEPAINRVEYARNSRNEGAIHFSNGDVFEGEFLNGRTCDRQGTLFRSADEGSVTGLWLDGLLEGPAEVVEGQQEGTRLSTYSRGVLHGTTRRFGQARARSDNLRMVAFYSSGRAAGVVWKGLIGGAFLVGPVDEEELVCGGECLYVYPDLHTVIVGKFEADRLVSGFTSFITDIAFENHVMVPKCSRGFLGQEVERDVASNVVISSWPLQRDHWEEDHVEVKTSRVTSELAGEGLFARKDLKAGQLVALFNGVRLQTQRAGSDCEDASDYRIRVNGQIDLDVPDHMRRLDQYCATLGHKANHSFVPNARWTRLEHPRFGLICSITANVAIKAGEEVLVNYGLGLSSAPAWYKALWVRHCREDRGMTDEQIREWCGRRYAMDGRVIELSLVSREKA